VPALSNRRFQFALAASLTALLLAMSPQTLTAQTTPATGPTQPQQIPLSHLYLHFFLYEAHLEHLALAHPIANPKGKPVKEHLRIKVGLSETEWQSIAASSLRVESAEHVAGAQAQALIAADRRACKDGPTPCTPPNLPQLKALQKQYRQAVDSEIGALESSLGPDSTAKLHSYLQTDLAAKVKPSPAAQAQTVGTVPQ